jgi:hypothetical protein
MLIVHKYIPLQTVIPNARATQGLRLAGMTVFGTSVEPHNFSLTLVPKGEGMPAGMHEQLWVNSYYRWYQPMQLQFQV